MVVIEDVSASLLDRLRQIAAPLAHDERGSGMENNQMRAQRIDALVALGKLCTASTFRVVSLIKNGSDIGYPFAVYAAEIGHDLEGLAPEVATAELMAAAVVSSDGFDSPVQAIKEHLDSLVTNPDVATKILVQLQQLALRMQQTSGVMKVNG
jgi:hypothetical protein